MPPIILCASRLSHSLRTEREKASLFGHFLKEFYWDAFSGRPYIPFFKRQIKMNSLGKPGIGGKPCLNVTIVFIIYRVIPSYIIDSCYPQKNTSPFWFQA